MKVTIVLRDDDLYRAIRVRAAASGTQIRDIVEEALREWLARQEDQEDLTSAREALAEYDSIGGDDANVVFRQRVAEGRVTYDADVT